MAPNNKKIAQLEKKIQNLQEELLSKEKQISILQKKDRMLKALIENQGEGIAILDKNENFTLANPALCRIFGINDDSMAGKNLREFTSDKNFQKIIQQTQRRKKGEISRYEIEIITADKANRNLLVTCSPKTDKDGNYIGSYGIFRDITEIIDSQKKLKSNQELLNAIAQNAQDAIIMADNSGKVIFWNKKAEDIFGYSFEEAKGKNLHSLIAPERYKAQQEKSFIRFQKSGKGDAIGKTVELFAINKDGDEFPVELSLSSVNINDKWHAIGIVRDITKRKNTQETLEESERLKNLILNSTHENFIYFDLELKIKWCNKAAAKSAHKKLEYLIGKYCYNVWYNSDKPCNNCPVLKTKKSGKPEQAELQTPDGRYWLVRAYPIFDKEHNLKALVEFTQDITERKANEQRLRESEERFRILVESAPMAIQMIRNGKFIYANPESARIMGYDNIEEIIGKEAITTLPEEERDKLRQRMENLKAGQSNPPIEVKLYTPDGRRVWSMSTSVKIILDGEPTIIIVGQDITKQKNLQAQLIQTQKMETIGTLAGGIAHDFNNLLTPIMGYSEMALLDIDEDSVSYNDILQIKKSADKAKKIVKQLLLFSRDLSEESGYVDLTSEVQQSLRLIRTTIPITVKINEDIIDEKIIVKADSVKINQMLMNLITNAYHAIEDYGVIDIKLEKEIPNDNLKNEYELQKDVYAKLTISDDGEGMDKDMLARIFEPFYTSKEVGKGTGLGLSVVHGIVKSYGGCIDVKSKIGQGSIFIIYLPIAHKSDAIDNDNSSYNSQIIGSGNKNKTILVIDDQKENNEVVSVILEKLGYDVISICRALDAFQILDNKDIAMILSDITMPDINGIDLVKKIRKNGNRIPIALMTGYSELVTSVNIKQFEIDYVLKKPIEIHSLKAMLDKILG
ncbi:MAG: PAS domain S-box protein [Candidatus Zixiibacteriota bacterium]